MDKSIHVTRFFTRNVILDIEVFYFSSKVRAEGGRIKLGNGCYAGLTSKNGIPCISNSVTNGRNTTKTSDDDTTVTRAAQAILLESFNKT